MQAAVPTAYFPDPSDDGKKRREQQIVMIENFTDAPLFGCGSLPELGVRDSIQRDKGGFALGIHQVEVFQNYLRHWGWDVQQSRQMITIASP